MVNFPFIMLLVLPINNKDLILIVSTLGSWDTRMNSQRNDRQSPIWLGDKHASGSIMDLGKSTKDTYCETGKNNRQEVREFGVGRETPVPNKLHQKTILKMEGEKKDCIILFHNRSFRVKTMKAFSEHSYIHYATLTLQQALF